MSDYTIGVILNPNEAAPNGENLFFAVLPFNGKMTRKGTEGRNEILAEIEKQFRDHSSVVDLTEAKRWLKVLEDRDANFERIEIKVKGSNPTSANVTDLYSGISEEINSPEDLAALTYAARKL